MKKWNTPAIDTLNVSETANGIFDCKDEFCIWTNDSKSNKNTPKDEPSETPEDLKS